MISIITTLLIVFTFFPISAISKMVKLSDGDMENVVAQAGITIGVSNYKTYRNFEYIGYKDTDSLDGTNGTIFFRNIEIVETLSTGNVDTNGDSLKSGVVIDVFSNPDGIPMVSVVADDFDHRYDFSSSSIEFCGTDIGKLDIGLIHPFSHRYYLTGHSSGFDFELDLAFEMEDFKYTYQLDPLAEENNKSFSIDKLYLAKTFKQNPLDDETDPSTWQPSGQFQIGDLNPYGGLTYNPATFDVGVDPDTNLAQIKINMPMAGSFRISNLKIGDQNFGPIAIDGIVVHKMTVKFIP